MPRSQCLLQIFWSWSDAALREYAQRHSADDAKDFQKANRGGKPGHLSFWQGPASTASAWRRSVAASERQNQPGVFSTLIGYEWTLAPGAAVGQPPPRGR